MIYELMNSEDLVKVPTSFIVGLELADEFVADLYDNEPENLFYEYTEEEIEGILNENEFFVISRNVYGDGDVEYFIEPLIHSDGNQYFLEQEVIFIEDDLVGVVDFHKLEGEMLTIKVYEEEIEDEEEHIFDELAQSFFDGLEEDDCPHCKLAELLEAVYLDGREDFLEDIKELV